MAHVAHARLLAVLNELANHPPESGSPDPILVSTAFLDAWSFVDSVDRFRSLIQLVPNARIREPREGEVPYLVRTEVIRSLRNLNDHVATRVDHILSSRLPVLGVLKWFTVLDVERGRVATSVLQPGTIFDSTTMVLIPFGKELRVPVSGVQLSAGAHLAELDDVYAACAKCIAEIESSLEASLVAQGAAVGSPPGADMLFSAVLELEVDTTAEASSDGP
jgi:hypothetical protein